MRPKSVVLQSQKELQVLEKNFWCRHDLQNGVRKIFLNKWVLRYLSLGAFKVLKNCSSQ